MSDTFITIIVIVVVALVMFAFPLITTANQNDKITQSSVQAIVSDFVNNAAKEGKITTENYDNFIQRLYATGNTYNIDLEVQVLDDNPGKKGTNIDTIGENIYYSVYTNTIQNELETKNVYLLKQGDYVKARVQNTNVTFGTQLKNLLYSLVGKDTIVIEAKDSALVIKTGKNK